MQKSEYVYQCSRGQTFDSVALELYGNEKYAEQLLEMNPAFAGRFVFEGGETLNVPVLEDTDRTTKAPWL